MTEQRLIDANDVYEIIGQTGVARVHVADIDQIKRIDPETLPIVRQLREELEKVTAERDAAIKDMETAMRFDYADDIWSFLCSVCENKFPDGKCSCVGDDCVPKWRGPQKEE